MPKPKLPVDLTKDGRTRTANTATDYVSLVSQGYVAPAEEDLSPAEKAARTRAANKAREQEETSNVPDGATAPAGDAV